MTRITTESPPLQYSNIGSELRVQLYHDHDHDHDQRGTGNERDIFKLTQELVERHMGEDFISDNTPESTSMRVFLMRNPHAKDAFRHVLGSMIQTSRSGDAPAALLGSFNEWMGAISGQPQREKVMDDMNNQLGRQLFHRQQRELGRIPTPDEMARYALENAILNGRAILAPSDPRVTGK
jgi:hypothetical protein